MLTCEERLEHLMKRYTQLQVAYNELLKQIEQREEVIAQLREAIDQLWSQLDYYGYEPQLDVPLDFKKLEMRLVWADEIPNDSVPLTDIKNISPTIQSDIALQVKELDESIYWYLVENVARTSFDVIKPTARQIRQWTRYILMHWEDIKKGRKVPVLVIEEFRI